MKQLVIIGAGNFGRELYWHCQNSIGYGTDFEIKGYIDDVYDPVIEKYKRLQAPWLGKIQDYQIDSEDVFICAVGEGAGREIVTGIIEEKGGQFANVIHETAILQGAIKMGKGVFIGPFTAIGDSAQIGNHVMLNTHSAIGHDAMIGDYTCIMSYVDVTGWCEIGKRVFLASGCRMTPKSRIGDDAYVGIGSVVLRRVKPNMKVFGNPAKVVDV